MSSRKSRWIVVLRRRFVHSQWAFSRILNLYCVSFKWYVDTINLLVSLKTTFAIRARVVVRLQPTLCASSCRNSSPLQSQAIQRSKTTTATATLKQLLCRKCLFVCLFVFVCLRLCLYNFYAFGSLAQTCRISLQRANSGLFLQAFDNLHCVKNLCLLRSMCDFSKETNTETCCLFLVLRIITIWISAVFRRSTATKHRSATWKSTSKVSSRGIHFSLFDNCANT